MNKRALKIIEDFKEDRKDFSITNPLRAKDFYLNVCYFLINSKRVKVSDLDDFNLLYDNLVINNEIIDSDNVGEYRRDWLEKVTGKKYSRIEKELTQGYCYLLNYYDPHELRYCSIKLKKDFNIFA